MLPSVGSSAVTVALMSPTSARSTAVAPSNVFSTIWRLLCWTKPDSWAKYDFEYSREELDVQLRREEYEKCAALSQWGRD